MPCRRTGLWTVLALVLVAALAPTAAAAPYTLHSCRTPDGAPAPADGWTFQVTGSGKPTADDCAACGSLRASFDSQFNHGHATSIALRFEAPADTTISGYDIDRVVRLARAGDDTWRFNYGFLRDELAYRGFNQADICQPSRNGCSAREGVFSESGLAIRRFFMFTDCNHSNGSTNDRCFAGDWTTSTEVRSARIRLDDAAPPAYSGAPAGSLLDTSAPVRGVAEATFAATDRGSGLRDAVLLVDGRAVASARVDAAGSTCQEPYVRAVPCPLESRGRLSLDTATLPDGPHDVALKVFDATGVNVAEHGPVRITTSNAPAPGSPPPGGGGGSSSPPPAAACLDRPPLAVTASLARSTVGYGSRATYRGRVRDAAGRAAAGVKVEVTGDGRTVAADATGAEGRFSVRIPRGANRSLRTRVAVPGGFACSSVRDLRVRAGATLTLSRRTATLGRRIGFSGRAKVGSRARRGKLVVLQVRDRGGRWQILKNLRTDSRGRFRYSYRFRRSRGVFTYRFRAQVPRERGVPYALGYSKTRKLTVRGR